ncbi:unnamed protein product [Discula destructiva]
MNPIFPWDSRDQEEQAESRYNVPLRSQKQQLENENMHLKRLLREHGIPWNDQVASHSAFQSSGKSRTSRRRSSRLSALDHTPRKVPHLPVEVILRIMDFSLLAKDPIIDPLSKINNEALTVEEAKRGPQIAIGFLATSKAYSVEGKRSFWTNNVFTFTSPDALRRFADLEEPLRRTVRHVNLRIIGRYYDDELREHRVLDFHPRYSATKPLIIIQRHKDPNSLSRPGFRCYTWNQTVDFLDALRAPFDPNRPKSIGPRPRLLPQLSSMRIDFVNFPEYFLPVPDSSFHDMAAHELGYSLNELMVTGLPNCEVGRRAEGDLQGMLKDDGLFVFHEPTYFSQKRSLKMLRATPARFQVVRAYRRPTKPKGKEKARAFPLAPQEKGHPESTWKKRQTIWKRVPISRDAHERKWMEFDRFTGESTDELYDESDEDVCPNCGIIHSMMSDMGSDLDSSDSDTDFDGLEFS